MDHPRFPHHQQHHHHHHHHQQRRYVPPPPPPPPPQHSHPHPPPPLQDSRHFYEPHHNNSHHLPPTPLPPPPPPSYRPLPAPPPPPPYNPHQSQFTFRNPSPNPPIDDHHHHLDFNPLPSGTFDDKDHRVRNRMPEFDHFSDSHRRDVWDYSPPRVLREDIRSVRAYPAVDLDHESRHHVFDRKPVSPYRVLDEFRHDSEGSSRFRNDFNDGYSQNHKEDFAWNRIKERADDDDYRRGSLFVSNHEKSYRNSGFGNSQDLDLNLSSRELPANVGNCESRYGSEFDGQLFRYEREDGLSENQRWGHSRQPLKKLPDSSFDFDMGNDWFRDGDGDKVRVLSGQRASRASEFESFDRKGSRESTQEYDRTPRKQIQKKSAFLRIQMGKPNYRNRDDAQLHSSGYYDDSNSSPFRCKDPPVYSNRRNKEDERDREGSPVELDVSFKSNLLVAKPVVTPSSPAVSSRRNLTPISNRKIRKLTYSDTDNSSSPKVKVSEGRLKSEISTYVSNCSSKSVMDLKLSEAKCTVSNGGNSSDVGSKLLSNGTDVLPRKRTVERSPKATVLAKDGSNVGSGGKSLPKVTKKKDVKKVMTHRSSSSNVQPAKRLKEPVKAVSSTSGPSAASTSDKELTQLKENTTSAGMVSGYSVDLHPSPNEVTMLSVSNQFDGSPQALVSEEGGTRIEICKEHLPDSDTVKNKISPKEDYHGLEGTLSLLNPEISKINEDSVDTDRLVDLQAISNPDCGLIVIQENTALPEIGSVEDVSKQSFKNGISVAFANDVARVYPQAMSTGDNLNVALSGSEESIIYKVPLNSHSASAVLKNDSSTDNGLINYHEMVTVSDVDTVDDDSKRPFPNQVAELHEHVPILGISKDVSSVNLSSSEEIINLEDPLDADCSNHGAVTDLSSDHGVFNLQEKITVPNIGGKDHFWKQPCLDEVTISFENGSKEGSSTDRVSAGENIIVASGKECSPNEIIKREPKSPQLNSLTPSSSDRCVGPLIRVGSGDGLNISATTPFKNFSSANEEITVYGVTESDVVLELCTDGFSDLQRKTSLEGFSEDKILVGDGINGSPNRISYECKKKRKLSNPPAGLSSPTVSEINEEPATADTSTSGAEVLLNSNNGLTQTGEIALSGMATVCPASLLSCLDENVVLHENTSARSFEGLGSVRDGFRDDVLNLEQQTIDSGSIIKKTTIPNMLSHCLLGLGIEHTENATSVMMTTGPQNVIMSIESKKEEETNVHSQGEQVIFNGETTQCTIPLQLQTPDSNQTFCSSDMECDSFLVVNDDLPSMSNFVSLSAFSDGVSTTDFTDAGMDTLPDIVSNMGSPESLAGVHRVSPKLSLGQISHEMVSGDDEKLEEKSVAIAASDLLSLGQTSSEMVSGADEKLEEKSVVGAGSDHVTEIDRLFTTKAVTLPIQDLKTITNCQIPSSVEANRMKNQLSYAPRMLPGRASVYFTNSGKAASSTQITKPRTWSRTGNPAASPLPGKKLPSTVPPLSQSSKKIGKVQTTYIRKGNSLVRKPPLVTTLPQGSHGLINSVYRLSPSGIGELKKSTGSDGRAHLPGPSNFSGTEGMNAASQKPQSVTLPHSPGDCTFSQLTEPVISGCSETTSEPKPIVDKDVTRPFEDAPKYLSVPENQSGPVKSLDSQGGNCDNLLSPIMRKTIYVKHKSNQLVAATTTSACNLSVKNADKTHASSSDAYYKRKKNQLIRTTLKSPFNQRVAVPDDSSNSEGQMAHRVTSSRSSSKRWPDKVVGTCKPPKSPLVWTLGGAQSSKEIVNSMQHQKVWPHLFPWKRGTYLKKFRHNSASIYSTSSMTSKKLLLLRNRGTVYTRSSHGFSLRKSKVLSVGGRSLKWSSSIEKRSKKANEEATLAVAAAEKKKREENGAASVMYGVKTRNLSPSKSVHGIKLHPGERIYRFGSVRYKMEASKRTLQRISDDDDTSFSAALQEKDVKKSYVPRRLVIGNDEYVRIGNGNQLIRDPKKRTRALASEKVRWSLHTARLRLARKRKYCQFFTRFGKCNKDNGKCPYIHDPSKIAVCTKFLKGLCSDTSCKLTHKVLPERMQDCSYFLQGLCSHENCPYRHVNVNPNASVCEGFLRGHCADGNECRKKHSYVCPVFKASGLCPQGSKCKLHHPKKRSEGKKKKRLREQNAQGRYFGSPQMDVAERGVVPEKHSTKNNDDDDLILADYIGLDVSDEEMGETMDLSRNIDDNDSPDGQVDDLDELVKPVRLMNNNLTT